jgi:hypothetical protein
MIVLDPFRFGLGEEQAGSASRIRGPVAALESVHTFEAR